MPQGNAIIRKAVGKQERSILVDQMSSPCLQVSYAFLAQLSPVSYRWIHLGCLCFFLTNLPLSLSLSTQLSAWCGFCPLLQYAVATWLSFWLLGIPVLLTRGLSHLLSARNAFSKFFTCYQRHYRMNDSRQSKLTFWFPYFSSVCLRAINGECLARHIRRYLQFVV